MDWWLTWKVAMGVGVVLCVAIWSLLRKSKGETRGYRILCGTVLSIALVVSPVCVGLADQP